MTGPDSGRSGAHRLVGLGTVAGRDRVQLAGAFLHPRAPLAVAWEWTGPELACYRLSRRAPLDVVGFAYELAGSRPVVSAVAFFGFWGERRLSYEVDVVLYGAAVPPRALPQQYEVVTARPGDAEAFERRLVDRLHRAEREAARG